MLVVGNCTDYLEGNYFTDITFVSEEQGNLYFTAQDEDEDQLAYIIFEYTNDDSCYVNVKYGENEPYMTVEQLVNYVKINYTMHMKNIRNFQTVTNV